MGRAATEEASRDAEALNESLKPSLKVLVVSDYYPPQTHGICTHCKDLVEWLQVAGCRLHVFTTCGEPSDRQSLLWSFPNPFNPLVRTAFAPSFKLLWQAAFGDWDVIHILYPSLIAWFVVLFGWMSGKVIYISHHCNEELGRLYLPTFIYYLALLSSVMVATLPAFLFGTVNAGATQGYNEQHFLWKHLPKERVEVVPSSVDGLRFHPEGQAADRAALRKQLSVPEGRPLWLVVSRLAVEKRVSMALDALRVHRELYPHEAQPVLVVAGDGPCRSTLEAQVKRDTLPVHFLGFVNHAEVPKLYRACDVCVTCSTQETFGLTVIESMACGCPQVLPHCDVFDELYKGVIGDWMFEANDAADLARALRHAATPASALALQEKKRNRAFGPHIFWSWHDAAEEQVAQYRRGQELLARKRCCRRHPRR